MGELRSKTTIGWRAVAGVLVPLIAMVGCSGSPARDDRPTISESLRELDPAQRTTPVTAGKAPGRAAVMAALWRLDPCALVGTGNGTLQDTVQLRPHTCSADLGGQRVSVDVGARFTPVGNVVREPRSVAGVAAYVSVSGSSAYRDVCRAWLPAGYALGIEVEVEATGAGKDDRSCAVLTPALRQLVSRVESGAAERRVPGVGAWDACTLLQNSLGDATREPYVVPGQGDNAASYNAYGTIDDCAVAHMPTEREQRQRQQGLMIPMWDNPLSMHTAPDASAAAFGGTRRTPIRGRQVYADGRCGLRWAESTTVIEVCTGSYASARRLAARVIRTLDGSPPDSGPRIPLLRGPADPADACRNYLPHAVEADARHEPCHPYAEPDVPDDPAEQVRAAQADPNVTCALAETAVRGIDEALRPATVGRDGSSMVEALAPGSDVCVFTDPGWEVQVEVVVSSDPLAEAVPAAESDTTSPSYSEYVGGVGDVELVGLGEDRGDPGYVGVLVSGLPRPDPYGDTGATAIERESSTVLEAIVDEHFEEAS